MSRENDLQGERRREGGDVLIIKLHFNALVMLATRSVFIASKFPPNIAL